MEEVLDLNAGPEGWHPSRRDDANTMSPFQVIEYLSKKGYSKTEAMLRRESENTDREGRPTFTRAEDLGGDKYKTGFSTYSSWLLHLSVHRWPVSHDS
jgi:hypothetical protein